MNFLDNMFSAAETRQNINGKKTLSTENNEKLHVIVKQHKNPANIKMLCYDFVRVKKKMMESF